MAAPASYRDYRRFSPKRQKRYVKRRREDLPKKRLKRYKQIRGRSEPSQPQPGRPSRPKPNRPNRPEAPNPAAPVTYDRQPQPWDARYEHGVGTVRRDREQSLAGLATQEQQVRQSYGFDDLSNPFSRAKLLTRSFQQRQRGSTGSYASRGQLYSGALQSAMEGNRFDYEADHDATRREYQAALLDLARQRTEATTGADDALARLELERLERAIQERPDPSEVEGEDPGTTKPPKRGRYGDLLPPREKRDRKGDRGRGKGAKKKDKDRGKSGKRKDKRDGKGKGDKKRRRRK